MIKLEDIFADFQIVDHQVLLSHFVYPKIKLESEKDVNYEFDYKIISSEELENTHVGFLLFQVNINYVVNSEKNDLIDCVMRGKFVGNPNVFNLEEFTEMLSLNGVATLSQLMRSNIQNLCLLANLNIEIKVPMINVVELKRIKELEA